MRCLAASLDRTQRLHPEKTHSASAPLRIKETPCPGLGSLGRHSDRPVPSLSRGTTRSRVQWPAVSRVEPKNFPVTSSER
jgi:hypothetical protein